MNYKKQEQETDSWKRLIGLLSEENNQLKNRLAEVLKNDNSKHMLAELEKFQTNFINIDELIYLLRRDVAEYDKWLQKKKSGDETDNCKIGVQLRELSQSIKTTEIKFWKLKSDFNRFLIIKNVIPGKSDNSLELI
ncbi:MAG: hypothetical protein JST63_20475 [Bacteroidetes bacterium]|nr:hypothetical protein [Bacteroidota bacterium]